VRRAAGWHDIIRLVQTAHQRRHDAALVFFLFDLLFVDGEDLTGRPLAERKARLAELLTGTGGELQYSDHQWGRGPEFFKVACERGLEGIVSKRADAPYVPGDRGLWQKTKCLHTDEFIAVGWSEPEGSRPISAHCCSVITTMPAGCITPAAPAPELPTPSLNVCTAGCSRSRSKRRPYPSRRHAPAISDRRSSCRAFIGCGLSWSCR
jgi:hypothetical protein